MTIASRAALLILAIGCDRSAVLTGRIHGLEDILEQAEENGAYNCAPRQFAVGQANLSFAMVELEQGNPTRAEEHMVIAEPNIRAAFRLSPAARCSTTGDRDHDGYLDAVDGCPAEPEDFDGFEDENGCPDDQDTDGDGIGDARDLCVLEREDPDGYLDADGCPELDNDVDQIADGSDRCTNVAEDIDAYQDLDGCPDLDNDSDSIVDVDDACPNEPGPPADHGCPRVYQDVQVTRTHIRISQKIHFEYNRAVIRAESFGILNTVAQVLNDYPDIEIEIQGHTDSQGSDSYNLRLSDQRANAVREYLVRQGIAPSRLTSQGYGETRPIESNRTNDGRAANRRVEFVRTDSGALAPQP